MKGLTSSLALGVCLLALSAGVAFADDIHSVTVNNTTTTATGGHTGTGSMTNTGQAIAGCGTTGMPAVLGSGAKTNSGGGSPFSTAAESNTPPKVYAGGGANPGTNPQANSQYDVACAQAELHSQLH
jgi:hypothetical protein